MIMRNLILIFVVFLVLSCKNDEKNYKREYLEAIKQNNVFLVKQMEVNIFLLKNKGLDLPKVYGNKFTVIQRILNNICNSKNCSDYQYAKSNIIDFAKNENIKFNFQNTDSDDVEVLKNNLLLNFIHLCEILKIFSLPVSRSTHCMFGPMVETENYTENDSININFNARYCLNYDIEIDSIVTANKVLSDFKSDKTKLIWKVKFKSDSKKTTIYWKAFYTEDLIGTILVGKQSQTITK